MAAVVDCFSRRAVGWSMRDDLRAQLVVDALEMVVARRRFRPGGLTNDCPPKRGRSKDFSQGRSNNFSRLAYVEVLADERAQSAVGFLGRALAWFAAQGCGSSA